MSLFLGILSILIAITSYSFYFRNILTHKTRPHGITWLIWGTLSALIFYQQATHGGGAGAWVTLVACFANYLIFALSLRYGEHSMTRLDYGCLVFSVVALVLWGLNKDSNVSAIIASIVFIIALIPTWRKSLANAYEETAVTYALNGLKFLIAFFALSSISFMTAFYPFVIFAANGIFATFLIMRRRSGQGIMPLTVR
jgi:divalent metal cation (Fe/Co/Zn/Cd) transporter